jgi:tripartite-type tricarboxylate transporter receptor subunit TctC
MRKLAVSTSFIALAALRALPSWPARAAFPDKPPRILVGYAAGGSSDLIARFIAEAASGPLGQRILVENKPGLNGVLAAEVVVRGTPDGYSVFQCPMSTLAITPQLIGVSVPVDPGTELFAISNMALSSYGLVVAASSPHKSMADVVAAARARPGQVTFASPGPGSLQHLSGELLMRLANLRMQHIPYKGSAPAAVDVIAGRVDFMITNLGDIGRQVQGGQMRLVAQGDPSKFPLFPDLPRIADVVPGFEITGWFGICGPKGIPAEAITRWDDSIRQAMQDPTFLKRLQDAGFTPHYEGPAAFARRYEADRKRWGDVIRASRIGTQ